MERYLKPGQALCLNGKEFIIDGIIGKGSSCVVYHAKCHDDTEHLIKEYNPAEIEVYRNEKGFLEVDNEEDNQKYASGLKRFVIGGEKQRKLRLSTEHKNTICNVQAVYNAFGTSYIDMTCFAGQTYEKIIGETLNVIVKRAKALAQIIGNYHRAGLLHLDIKPENIFTISETDDFIMLFDFDSVVGKTDLPYGATLSYTKSWAAPEQLLPGRQNKICEATDIFAIGEIVFYKIFGRHSSLEEKRSFAEYQYDFESQALKNVNPKVKPLLDELFHHTICSNVKKRYQSAEDLTEILDNLIKISNTEKPYIKTSLPEPEAFFVGRDREIAEISKKLQESRILYLSGIGGIGKSELAKQYAKKALKIGRYNTVLFMPFVTDIMSMITDDNTVPIYNFFKYPEEEIQDYYNRKMRKLNELCDDKTLIIIDNFDIDDVNNIDAEFKKIKEFNCNVLITTRFDFNGTNGTEEYVQYRLNKIDNEKDIINIFNQYYTKPIGETEKEQIKEIIAIVDSHTLAVELLAKQMTAGRVTPEKMLEKLKEGGIEQSGNESVLSVKDGDISRKNTYTHIKALFDISGLSGQEQYVLANLSLIPHTGISAELFHDWCELESYEEINTLSTSGWIRWNREKDIISLHHLIAEVAIDRTLDTEIFNKFLFNYSKWSYNVIENNVKTTFSIFDIDKNMLEIFKRYFFVTEEIFSTIQSIGDKFFTLNRFKYSEEAYDFACKISNELNIAGNAGVVARVSLAHVKETIASHTSDKNMLIEAISIYLEAIEFEKRINDENYTDKTENIATLYSYTGDAYYDIGLLKEAREMYINGINTYNAKEHLNDGEYTGFGVLYNNLANTYKNVNKAMTYYLKAEEIHKKNSNITIHLVTTWYHIANIYFDKRYKSNNTEKSFKYIRLVENYFNNNSDNLYMKAKTSCLLGQIYMSQGNKQLANEKLIEAKDLILQTDFNNSEESKQIIELLKKIN